MSYESVPRWMKEITEHFKTQEICNETVVQFPHTPMYVPDHLKTKQMCNQAVRDNPAIFFLVPDGFITQELCIKALEVDPWQLNDILYYLKTQKMCDETVKDDPSSLKFIPDWFVTQQQIDAWHDDKYSYFNYEIIEWYDSYQKQKAQKAKIKEELMPIAWHLHRVMDWCMSGDKKG